MSKKPGDPRKWQTMSGETRLVKKVNAWLCYQFITRGVVRDHTVCEKEAKAVIHLIRHTDSDELYEEVKRNMNRRRN